MARLYSIPVSCLFVAITVALACVLEPPEWGWVFGTVVLFLITELVVLPGVLCSGLVWRTHRLRKMIGLGFVIAAAIILPDHVPSIRGFAIAAEIGLLWGLVERLLTRFGPSTRPSAQG